MLKIKNILVPTDGSECAKEGLKYAIDFAVGMDVTIHLLTVENVKTNVYYALFGVEDPDGVKRELKKVIFQSLESMVRDINVYGVKVETNFRFGTIVEEILNFIKEKNIDLVVMGSHGRTGFTHALLGSVAEKIVRLSPVPVLVVKPPNNKQE